MPFHRLPVGAKFEFRGRRYQKLALSMAGDEDRFGNIFHAETEVVPEPRIESTHNTERLAEVRFQ